MKKRTSLLGWIIALLIPSAPYSAPAQTADTPAADNSTAQTADQASSSGVQQSDQNSESAVKMDPYTLNEKRVVDWNSQMTFSGGHTAGSLLEIPTNITILTADYLSDIGASNLVQALEYGGSGTSNRVAYREDLTVRGFRQTPLRDGTPFPNLNFNLFYDIDKIEVIKGPDALMFNSYGNLSGGVNFVTKRPTAEPSGDLSLTVGNFGLYTAAGTSAGPINRSGSVRYRVSLEKQLYSGWQGQGTDANNYNNEEGGSVAVDWDLTPKLLVRFDLGEDFIRQRDYSSGLIDPVTGTVWSGSVHGYSISSNWSYFDTNTNRGTIEAIFRATDELTFRVKTTSYSSDWDYDFVNAEGVNGANFLVSEYPNYTQIIGLYAEKFLYNNLDVNTYLDMSWKRDIGFVKLQVTAGYNYFENTSNYDLWDTPIPNQIIDAPVDSRSPFVPFAQLLPSGTGPQLQQSLSVTRNGGWSAYTQETLSALNGRLIGVAGVLYVSPSTNSPAKSAVLGNYGVIVRLTPTISAYGSTGQSFIPESGFDAFGYPLKNEPGHSTEGGLKLNALNEHLFGVIDYFSVVQQNVLNQTEEVSLTTGKLGFGNAQTGQQTNSGWEVDLGWVQPLFGLGEWSTFVTGYKANPLGANGLQPHAAQDEKVTVFTKWAFTSGLAKGWEFGVGSDHEGGSPGSGFVWQPAYSLYSAFLGYVNGHYKFTVNVDNLADKRNAILGSESPGDVYLNPPLSWKTAITYKW